MGQEEDKQRATDAYAKMCELGVDQGVSHTNGFTYTSDTINVNVSKVENPEEVKNIAQMYGAKIEYTKD
jgi:hypothetical protein